MAVSLLSNELEDEEYIDMEVSSYSSLFSNTNTNTNTSSSSSPPHPREFEFQMSSVSMERGPSTSPADELFYKGKLLPLHLPPRLQMVEKLLIQNSNSVYRKDLIHNNKFEEEEEEEECFYSTPLATTLTTPTTTSTPFESANISPADSCTVSRELNPEDYFFAYSADEDQGMMSGFIGGDQSQMMNNKKYSSSAWSRKLKLIKQSASIGSKLKASRAYLKSLFGKSGCSDESCKVADEGFVSKSKERSDYKYNMKDNNVKRNGLFEKEKIMNNGGDNGNGNGSTNRHRRSFSLALRRHSTANSKYGSSSSSTSSSSSSSSSSNASNGFQYLQFLKRSSSVNAEVENPIQGAIAHCKQSHHQLMSSSSRSRKTVSEVGFYSSFSPSSIAAACEDQERPQLCRG